MNQYMYIQYMRTIQIKKNIQYKLFFFLIFQIVDNLSLSFFHTYTVQMRKKFTIQMKNFTLQMKFFQYIWKYPIQMYKYKITWNLYS